MNKDQTNASILQGRDSGSASGIVTGTLEYRRLKCHKSSTVVVLVVYTPSRVYAECLLRKWTQLPIHWKQMHPRSDQKVPGLIAVFRCALGFSKDFYMMCCSNILATYSLQSFFSALFISKYFIEHGSTLASIVTIFLELRPLMRIIIALAFHDHF